MNKPIIGIAVGAVLGVIDGATAWFEPKLPPDEISSILFFSGIKGMIVGMLCGFFANKVQSPRKGIIFGAVAGLIFAAIVAFIPRPDGQHFYLQITVPGFILGALIGYLTQRWGKIPAARTS